MGTEVSSADLFSDDPNIIVTDVFPQESLLNFWTFLVYCLVVVVAFLFLIFYINRVFAQLLSKAITVITWPKWGAFIEVESIHFALIAGRIMFKNVRYHSKNQSFSILKGSLTFRYWFRNVRGEVAHEATPLAEGGEGRDRTNAAGGAKGSSGKSDEKPCRILLAIEGFEWFIYNRISAYDYVQSVLDKTSKAAKARSEEEEAQENRRRRATQASTSTRGAYRVDTADDRRSGYEADGGESLLHPRSATSPMRTADSPDVNTSFFDFQSPANARPNQSSATKNGNNGNAANDNSWFRRALPIEISCETGSIMIGNHTLPSIMVTVFTHARGIYETAPSRSRLDHYKTVMQFAFRDAKISLKTNVDYKGDSGIAVDNVVHEKTFRQRFWSWLCNRANRMRLSLKFRHTREKRLNRQRTSLRFSRRARTATFAFNSLVNRENGMPTSSSSSYSLDGSNAFSRNRSAGAKVGGSWHGLPRYQDEDDVVYEPIEVSEDVGDEEEPTRQESPKKDEAKQKNYHKEYAKVDIVLEATGLDLTYYADVPGKVALSLMPDVRVEDVQIGNGDLSPEWGLDINLRGASINYGPWMDRQRFLMQNFFFPSTFRDNEMTPILQPGEERVHTALKIFIQFEQDVIFKIPMREASKDWRWDQTPTNAKNYSESSKRSRPYGWIGIKAAAGSTIKYTVPMITDAKGYESALDIRLEQFVIETCINYDILISGSKMKLQGNLPTPLVTNAARKWSFDLTFIDAKLFVLRDHITLMQDLISDWTSEPGLGEDLRYFIPMEYALKMEFQNVQIYLCVNEHNIVDLLTNLPDNGYLIISAPSLEATVLLPFLRYKPDLTCIPFDIIAYKATLSMPLAKSNTDGEFLTESSKEFCNISELTANGSYSYYGTVDAETHLESLSLDVKGSNVQIKLFGFVMKYILILRDNYFGNFTNFYLCEEYINKLAAVQSGKTADIEQEAMAKAAAKKPADPFEFYITLTVEEGAILLPENLYSCERASLLEFQELQIENRNVDAYMDLQINFSPITWSRDSKLSQTGSRFPVKHETNQFLYIEGVSIHAHRMFGPLPSTITYVVNWEIDIDGITGQMHPAALLGLEAWTSTFGYSMNDIENAIPPDFMTVLYPDVTFLRVYVGVIDVSIWGNGSGTDVQLKEGIKLHLDDLCNVKYSTKVVLKIPDIRLRHIANGTTTLKEGSKNEFGDQQWVEVGRSECGVHITLCQHTSDWAKRRASQQAFLREQDKETLRCPHLYQNSNSEFDDISERNHPVYLPLLIPSDFDQSTVQPHDLSDTRDRNVMTGVEHEENAGYYSDIERNVASAHREQGIKRFRSFSCLSALSASSEVSSFISASEAGSGILLSSFSPGIAEVNRKADEIRTTAKPRSIPYSSYLQRYHVVPSRAHVGSHLAGFVRPISSVFVPVDTPFINTSHAFRTTTESDQTSSVPHLNETLNSQFEDFLNLNPLSNVFDEDGNSETKTTLIINPTKDLSVLVTPVFIKIVQEFLEELNPQDINLESVLDQTQMRYMEALTRIATYRFQRTEIALAMPSVHMDFIQDIMLPNDLTHTTDAHAGLRTRYDLSDTLLCTGDLNVRKLLAFGIVQYEYFTADEGGGLSPKKFELSASAAHISVENLKFDLRFVSGSNTAGIFGVPDGRQSSMAADTKRNIANEPVVLDAYIENSVLTWSNASTRNELSLKLADFSFIFVSQSVEILVGAVYSWLTFVDDLRAILDKFEQTQRKQLQYLFSEIAKFSSRESAFVGSDPAFLTTSSTFSRLGPRRFQNDTGWRLLARVRHCFRAMPAQQKELLQVKITSSDLIEENSESMYALALRDFSTWKRLEHGGNDLRNCVLLQTIFRPSDIHLEQYSAAPILKTPGDVQNDTSWIKGILTSATNCFSVVIENVSVCLFEPQHENSLLVRQITLDAATVYLQRSSDADYSSRYVGVSAPPIIEGRYLDVLLGAKFGQVNVIINPYVLAFIKHLLRVQRGFADAEAKTNGSEEFKKANVAANMPSETGRTETSQNSNFSNAFGTQKSTREVAVESGLLGLLQDLNIVTHGVIFVDGMTLNASANKLLMQVRTSNAQLSAIKCGSNGSKHPGSVGDLDQDSVRSDKSDPNSTFSVSGGRLLHSTFAHLQRFHLNIKERNMQNVTTLGSFDFRSISANACVTQRPNNSKNLQSNRSNADGSKEILHLATTLRAVSVKFPQSLLKLYTFVDDWRTENLPNYDFLFTQVVSEWEEGRKRTNSVNQISKDGGSVSSINEATPSSGTPSRDIKLQILLHGLALQADILPSLRLRYEASGLTIDLYKSLTTRIGSTALSYSGQLKRQEIYFVQRRKRGAISPTSQIPLNEHSANFTIPSIRSNGEIKIAEVVQHPSQDKILLARTTRSIKISQLEAFLTLDHVKATLNAHMIDQLLTAHSVLGAEINDTLDVFAYAKRKRQEQSNPSPDLHKAMSMPNVTVAEGLQFTVRICLHGLSLSAVSPAAVVTFDSDTLHGVVMKLQDPTVARDPGIFWRFSAKQFALSLCHQLGSIGTPAKTVADRERRVAYILTEFSAQNFESPPDMKATTFKSPSPRKSKSSSRLEAIDSIILVIPRIHAVMQPSAIGKLADMYVYYSKELQRRKKVRANDIGKLSDNTRRILRSMDIEVPKYTEKSKTLLSDKRLSLQIAGVIIAMPLEIGDEITSTISRNTPAESSKLFGEGTAFLLFADGIEFSTKKWEVSSGTVINFGAQFVSKFDQSTSASFTPEFREGQRMNRILLPSITCRVNSTSKMDKKQIWIDANVPGGFQMDIDGSIVHHVNTLFEIWEQSKKTVTVFYELPDEGHSREAEKKEAVRVSSEEATSLASISLELEAIFFFLSGTCKFYPQNQFARRHSLQSLVSAVPAKTKHPRKSSLFVPSGGLARPNPGFDNRAAPEEWGVDVLIIPGLNMRCSYKTPLGVTSLDVIDPDARKAHIELIIHPSNNIFYPSLIPFVQELLSGIKVGMQHKQELKEMKEMSNVHSASVASQLPEMNVTLFLRLLRTTVDLSCQPTSKVMCTLNWEEGNFLLSSALGNEDNSHSMSCTGEIYGFSGRIRHAFSPEDCIRGETKDIMFNATMLSRRGAQLRDDSLSVILEVPSITAELKIRHLQDLFLFSNIWINRTGISSIPQVGSHATARLNVHTHGPPVSSLSMDSAKSNTKPLSIYCVLRLNQMKLASDLGQAIGTVTANIENVRFSYKMLPGKTKEAITSIDSIDFLSQGRLQGTAKAHNLEVAMQSCLPHLLVNDDGSSLVTTGHISISRTLSALEYEFQKILVLDIDPVMFVIKDKWQNTESCAPLLNVYMEIILAHVEVIMSIKTIPIFVAMFNRMMALTDEKRLAAEAVMSRGKGRASSGEMGISNVPISGTSRKTVSGNIFAGGKVLLTTSIIRLSWELLSFSCYPRHFYDEACVQAKLNEVKILLNRSQTLADLVQRQTSIMLKGGSISKCTCKRIDIHTEKEMTITQWFEHANSAASKNILNFPTTKIRMSTTQQLPSNVVEHQFVTDFEGRVDVALNFGLLKYLQDLGALFEEQMQRSAKVASSEGPKPSMATSSVNSSRNTSVKTRPSNEKGRGKKKQVELSNKDASGSTSPTSVSSKGEETDPIIFQATQPVKFDPQLKVMGDATPPLEWVGVQRQRVPGVVHTNLTIVLEELALLAQEVYAGNALMPVIAEPEFPERSPNGKYPSLAPVISSENHSYNFTDDGNEGDDEIDDSED